MSEPHKPDPFPPNTTPRSAGGFDPHLKAAMEEVKAILDKYQCGAYVVLQSPFFSEFLIHFPTWGCIALIDAGDNNTEVRVYAKREQFPSREAQKAHLEASAGMILHLDTVLTQHANQFRQLGKMLGAHFDIDHADELYRP